MAMVKKIESGDLSGLSLDVVEDFSRQGHAIRSALVESPVGPNVTRSCGDCRACCSTLGIEKSPGEEGLGLVSEWSAPGEACKHECATGCAVYDRRPLSCRGYTCWWLRGWGDEKDDRPDRLGLIFDDSIDYAALMALGPMRLGMVSETRPDVISEQRQKLQTFALNDGRMLLVRTWGQMHPREAIGPEPLMDRIREVERQMGARSRGR